MVNIDLVQVGIIVIIFLFLGSVLGYIPSNRDRSVIYETVLAGLNVCKKCLYKCGVECLDKGLTKLKKRECFKKCPMSCKNSRKCRAKLLVDISRNL